MPYWKLPAPSTSTHKGKTVSYRLTLPTYQSVQVSETLFCNHEGEVHVGEVTPEDLWTAVESVQVIEFGTPFIWLLRLNCSAQEMSNLWK